MRALPKKLAFWSDGVHNIVGYRNVGCACAGNIAHCRQNVSLQQRSLPVAKCLPPSQRVKATAGRFAQTTLGRGVHHALTLSTSCESVRDSLASPN
jgi:hypothetical protein